MSYPLLVGDAPESESVMSVAAKLTSLGYTVTMSPTELRVSREVPTLAEQPSSIGFSIMFDPYRDGTAHLRDNGLAWPDILGEALLRDLVGEWEAAVPYKPVRYVLDGDEDLESELSFLPRRRSMTVGGEDL